MTLPMVPYEGRMSYCLIKSIQMVLAHQGHPYDLPWLETVSGEVFGFAYIRGRPDTFAIVGYIYHEAGEHLLQTLNYDYSYTGAPDADEAVKRLENALKQGPVVAGMLDMGFLTYSPMHHQARGADHAIAVLALHPDEVIVHDPDGYVAVPLPLNDFLEAWQRDIYTGKPYGLWQIGAQRHPPSEAEIWERTLERARQIYTRTTEEIPGAQIIYGPEGMRTLAADFRTDPGRELGALPYFNWRVSAQRCFDGAMFLRERLPEASAIRWEQCQIYGRLQQASAARATHKLPNLLERLADHEACFIASLG
jgi:hypothetical protein